MELTIANGKIGSDIGIIKLVIGALTAWWNY